VLPLGVCQVAAVLLVAVSTCPVVGAVDAETETVVVADFNPLDDPAVRLAAVPVRPVPAPMNWPWLVMMFAFAP
jgi:hypothetical protein